MPNAIDAPFRELTVDIDSAAAQRMFSELPRSVQSRIMARRMRAASGILDSALKAEAPKDTGLLRQAIGSTTVKQYGYTLFLASGVRRGFRKVVSPKRRGRGTVIKRGVSAESADAGMVRNPTKYLHLIVGGRKAIHATKAKVLYSRQSDTFFGKSVQKTTPDDFVTRAFDSAKSQVIASVEAGIAEEIETEASRLGH